MLIPLDFIFTFKYLTFIIKNKLNKKCISLAAGFSFEVITDENILFHSLRWSSEKNGFNTSDCCCQIDSVRISVSNANLLVSFRVGRLETVVDSSPKRYTNHWQQNMMSIRSIYNSDIHACHIDYYKFYIN